MWVRIGQLELYHLQPDLLNNNSGNSEINKPQIGDLPSMKVSVNSLEANLLVKSSSAEKAFVSLLPIHLLPKRSFVSFKFATNPSPSGAHRVIFPPNSTNLPPKLLSSSGEKVFHSRDPTTCLLGALEEKHKIADILIVGAWQLVPVRDATFYFKFLNFRNRLHFKGFTNFNFSAVKF